MLILRDLYVIVNYIKYKSEIDNVYWKILFEIWLIYKDFFKWRVYYIYVYVILFEME